MCPSEWVWKKSGRSLFNKNKILWGNCCPSGQLDLSTDPLSQALGLRLDSDFFFSVLSIYFLEAKRFSKIFCEPYFRSKVVLSSCFRSLYFLLQLIGKKNGLRHFCCSTSSCRKVNIGALPYCQSRIQLKWDPLPSKKLRLPRSLMAGLRVRSCLRSERSTNVGIKLILVSPW